MRKINVAIILLFVTLCISAQDKPDLSIGYDSMKNFLHKNIEVYKGQELYLRGLDKSSQSYGYSGFILKYKNDDALLNDEKNIYKPNDNYNSRYEDLVGRYFNVLDVIRHANTNNEYYLKLQELSSGDIVYYKYDTNSEFTFPFIVRGFLEKQKQLLIAKEYVIADDILKVSRNLVTGKGIVFTTGDKWTCTDITIDNRANELVLVLQNKGGVKITVPYSTLTDEGIKKIFTADEATTLTRKYNVNNFRRILQNKIRVGMTKEMTRMAWGEPTQINQAGTNKEQWIYPAGTLSFNGDKIISTK
ncbi:MAG: hypothetical protein E6767_17435 [Dysgonomonas sp.]|nr:hypothetical protein [Dysgonomonas sp.]